MLKKQTNRKGQHNFTLFYLVCLWWTLCSGDIIFLQEQLDGKKYEFEFVSLPPKLHSAPLKPVRVTSYILIKE